MSSQKTWKHPLASIKENVKKYILNNGYYKWVWGYVDSNKSEVILKNISEVLIIRYPLLKLDKNPYLLENKEYFNNRIVKKTEAKFRAEIYKKYKHTCIECEVSLHNGERVELHHLISVKKGGKYSLDNIVPLHQICHQRITHSKHINNFLVKKVNKLFKA